MGIRGLRIIQLGRNTGRPVANQVNDVYSKYIRDGQMGWNWNCHSTCFGMAIPIPANSAWDARLNATQRHARGTLKPTTPRQRRQDCSGIGIGRIGIKLISDHSKQFQTRGEAHATPFQRCQNCHGCPSSSRPCRTSLRRTQRWSPY